MWYVFKVLIFTVTVVSVILFFAVDFLLGRFGSGMLVFLPPVLISDPKIENVLCNAENFSKPSGVQYWIQFNFCKTWYQSVCVKLNL